MPLHDVSTPSEKEAPFHKVQQEICDAWEAFASENNAALEGEWTLFEIVGNMKLIISLSPETLQNKQEFRVECVRRLDNLSGNFLDFHPPRKYVESTKISAELLNFNRSAFSIKGRSLFTSFLSRLDSTTVLLDDNYVLKGKVDELSFQEKWKHPTVTFFKEYNFKLSYNPDSNRLEISYFYIAKAKNEWEEMREMIRVLCR